MKMSIRLQNESDFSSIPASDKIQQWIDTSIQTVPIILNPIRHSLTIRFIDENESASLNEQFRHKKGPTNVQAFPDESIEGFESDSLGDLAICVPLLIQEASNQQKTTEAHFVHLIVHGLLHLLGYDHQEKKEASEMENLETAILKKIGFENPYLEIE